MKAAAEVGEESEAKGANGASEKAAGRGASAGDLQEVFQEEVVVLAVRRVAFQEAGSPAEVFRVGGAAASEETSAADEAASIQKI